jgi:diaminohydroxyphosphoribosylaminopyrimidine deaminase/5-amino-6-(5-phosphoribosylamino)uracil reductase
MMSQDSVDIRFMRKAVRLAKKGLGRTSPNPAVGTVIVRDGNVLSKGYHRRAGAPHAEIEALKRLGGNAPGAAMYVTLEPCNHFGRTPPCTEAILASGIKRVVIGMRDPNPGVRGGGAAFLAEHHIQVELGVLEAECRELNEGFVKHVSSGRPFVMVKSAQTLDGWTATSGGDSRWITNERSREYVHQLRDRVDAVMVGIGTILADDPRLTCRLKHDKGKDPLRIVVDTHLRTPAQARIVKQESSSGTMWVVGSGVKKGVVCDFEKGNNTVVSCPTKQGRIDMESLLDILGEKMITSLLVEGGAGIIGSLLRGRLVDKFYIFKAPRLLGGGDGVPMASGPGPRMMKESVFLKDIRVKRFGDDILVVGYPDYAAAS